MRKFLLVVMMGLMIGASVPSARAEEEGDDENEKKFEVTGEFRLRYDRLDNYTDSDEDGLTTFDDDIDDLYSLWPYRARVGVSGMLADNVRVVLEIQNFGALGNQSPAQSNSFPPFQNIDGDSTTPGQRKSETSLYQGLIALDKVAGSHLNLVFGRQEYQIDDDGLNIGNEEFYNGTVFDGVKSVWDEDRWSATAFYFVNAERNDLADPNSVGFGSFDQRMIGVVGAVKLGEDVPSTVNGYIIHLADGFSFDAGSGTATRFDVNTLGAHWWRSVRNRDDARASGLEWNAEFAIQRGNATDLDTGDWFPLRHGYICNDTLGYNFVTGSMMHRFYGNFLRVSGDDNLTNDEINGYVLLFPRLHGRFGNIDYFDSDSINQNAEAITSYSIGYDLNINDGEHVIGARVWKFVPTEDRILVDPDEEREHVDDYGKEVDVTWDHMYSKHTAFELGVAVLWPDNGLVAEDSPDDKVTRAWGQVKVRF